MENNRLKVIKPWCQLIGKNQGFRNNKLNPYQL